jgi:hypothetical protein
MEKETKLKLHLFWLGVSISIIGWAVGIWYVTHSIISMEHHILSRFIAEGIMLGTLLFGFFWVVLFGTICYMIKKTSVIFKIFLLIYIGITLFEFTVHILPGTFFSFFLAFFCAIQLILDMDRRGIRTNVKETRTKIASFAFVAISALAFCLLFFKFFPDPDILWRVIFNATFAVIIASHVWVAYGMILYAKAIHKSIRES